MPALASPQTAIIWSSLFVVGFLALSVAAGRRLLIVLGVGRDGPLVDRAVVAAGLGVGAMQFVPFLLGATGTLGVRSIRVTMAVLALVLLPDLRAVVRGLGRALGERQRPQGWQLAWLAALVPAMLIVAMLALTPTIDPDGLAYHLTVPKRWLEHGAIDYLPTYQPSNSPMGVEMLFTIALAFAGDVAAKELHFALGVIGAVGLYLAGKRWRGELVGALAATLFLVGPAGAGVLLGCAYVEGAAGFAMIGAAMAWLAWSRGRRAGWLRCAAVLAGVGASFKITAALFPVALGALTILVLYNDARQQQPPGRPALRSLWGMVPLLALPVAPWLVRSLLLTGNPLFPMFATVIPSRDMSPALSAAYDKFNRYNTWGTGFGPQWSVPLRQKILAAAGGALVVAGIFIYTRMRTWMARATVIVLLLTSVAQLLAAGLYVRYWIPLLSVLQLPLAAVVLERLSTRWRQGAVLVVTLLVSLMTARRGIKSVDGDLGGLAKTAVGLQEPRAFVAKHIGLLPLYEHGNRELPATARVLLACTCIGFYLDRTTYCSEFPQDSLRFTTWDEFLADVHRLGVTHVMAPRVLAGDGDDPPLEISSASMLRRRQEYAFVRRMLSRHGRLLASASDQGLYEIDSAALD
jgi:hypothetical protein